jgi:hypothetical protein
MDLGDGKSYFGATQAWLPFYSGIDTSGRIWNRVLTANFKELYFGFIPNMLIPDYLYGKPDDMVYFFWQACFHVILLSVCVLLAKRWRVMRDEYLFCIIAFAAMSPSFLEMTAVPHRHYVTFFSLLLFYISFRAITRAFTISKLVWLIVSLAIVAVSKIGYLVPICLYCAYDLILVKEQGRSKTAKYLLTVFLLGAVLCSFVFFVDMFSRYGTMARANVGTFGSFVRIPLLGVFVKYLYALLSPFPWQKADYYIATIYGGNPLHFVMHVLSALTGIYFFARLIVYMRPLFRAYRDLRPPILYGLLLSLTILRGATGFHGYLSILFPFFAPLLAIKEYRISWWIPLGIALCVEGIYTMAMLFM